MESAYLRTLVESVATGSFSKAADNLFITQSAVSRRIKFLEEQYGHSLIDRSGPVLVATDVGRIVLEKAEKILQMESDLLNDINIISQKPGMSFCCTPSFGITYLPEIMKGFMVIKPDMMELKFSFEMPDKVVEGMRKGLYQVAVIEHIQDYDLTEFDVYELPGDEVVFVSSPRLGLVGEVIPLERLVDFDLYTRNEGCCSTRLLEYNIKKMNKDYTDFNRVIFYDDIHLIISSVVEGLGLGFVSMSVVKKLVGAGVLLVHRVPDFDHAHKRTLIVNKTSEPTKLLDSFIKETRAVFEKLPTQIEILSCLAVVFCAQFALGTLYMEPLC